MTTLLSVEQSQVHTILKALDNLALDYGDGTEAANAARELKAQIRSQNVNKKTSESIDVG